jgi:archaemetzincin
VRQINLISFGQFEVDFVHKVAEAASHEYGYNVAIREGHLDLADFFDPTRRQYNANELLKMVDTLFGDSGVKSFGLFNVDLFIPILTYIFGQAFLGGRTGIASTFRLSNDRYGLANKKETLLERTIKEVNHELGHTFGLVHCHVPGCVMASSTYVEDIDQKKTTLCPNCRKLL